MANDEGELINTLGDQQHARVQSAVDLLVALHDQVAVASLSGSPKALCHLTGTASWPRCTSWPTFSPSLVRHCFRGPLRLGDLSRLDDAISFVERYGPPPGESTEPSYQGTDNTGYVRGQILNAISRLDDDAAAPLLNPLLQSPDSWVRRNVADADWRRACHASSMPYFAAALDDPDAGVAMAAIYGLLRRHQRLNWSAQQWTQYRGTGGGADRVPERDSGMLPNTDEFQKDPDLYRRFWKDWWETKGRDAYAAWERSHAAEATP